MGKLLILDINGVVCRKVKHAEGIVIAEEDLFTERDGVFLCRKYGVVRAVGCCELLTQLLDLYNVAFWTSTTKHNAAPILEWLFPKNLLDRLLFVWYRDRVRLDMEFFVVHATGLLFSPVDTVEMHDTIKMLEDVWMCPTINCGRQFNATNTLLVDDTHQKVRFNRLENIVLVPSGDTVLSEGEISEESWKANPLDIVAKCFLAIALLEVPQSEESKQYVLFRYLMARSFEGHSRRVMQDLRSIRSIMDNEYEGEIASDDSDY